MDSLKILFSGENLTIKQEDLEKILKVIKEW
jgi:DNA-directed RNA polymerase subunit F